MPGELQAAQREQLHEVSDMQPGGGRVEAAVDRDQTRTQRPAQLVEIGRVGEQASPAEFVDDVVHACMVPPTGGQGVTSLGRRGTCARYTETVGSPSSQNRHGTSAALLTPTRGPVIIFSERTVVLALAGRTRSGESAAQTSAPSRDLSMSSAWQS